MIRILQCTNKRLNFWSIMTNYDLALNRLPVKPTIDSTATRRGIVSD